MSLQVNALLSWQDRVDFFGRTPSDNLKIAIDACMDGFIEKLDSSDVRQLNDGCKTCLKTLFTDIKKFISKSFKDKAIYASGKDTIDAFDPYLNKFSVCFNKNGGQEVLKDYNSTVIDQAKDIIQDEIDWLITENDERDIVEYEN